MIILSLDFGTKNIGVAIGQQITCTANTRDSIKVKNGIPDWGKISLIINNWKPKIIIIGKPLNMNGSYQNIIKKIKRFAKELYEKFYIKIKLYDERLTTIEAKSILFKIGGYKKLNKNIIDSLSAALILESWCLNYKKNKK
ncbi:Holliday junction resolvase RuvX [Buchnera aphidicola]|uniref:Holliday junction resolvase RuvX n=1 Tax=Buchnera aphidicola TaxID=9 RepID=UPI0034641F6F